MPMPLRPSSCARWLGAGLLAAAGLCLGVAPAGAQPAPAARAKTAAGPAWSELNARQQAALQPLAPHWAELSDIQKRKWLTLSRNFASMSPQAQQTLHARMTEWAGLSGLQRAQARLNFAEIMRLAPADERKAKWEAYQALSPEERRGLAERGSRRPPGAAVPIRPVPSQKLVPVPPTARGQHTPRIQLAPPAAKMAAPADSLPPAPPATLTDQPSSAP